MIEHTTNIKSRINGIDSLRFFAFLIIFLHHATPYIEHAYLGLDYFFVLSSFLLTFLLLKEIKQTGEFSSFNFFMRRVLRIFPLYYLVISVSFFLLPTISAHFGFSPNLPEKKWLYWFLLSNYETTDCIYYLKFLWAIALEEQFYLLFIALGFLLNRYLFAVVTALIVVYFIFMAYAEQNGIGTYLNPMGHFPNFGIGMLCAYIHFKNINQKYFTLTIFVLSLIGLFIIENHTIHNLNASFFFGSTILIAVNYSHHLKNLIPFKITEELGRYTYGLYVYSGIVITFASKVIFVKNLWVLVAIEFVILLVLAYLSYHLFEKQFLKLKRYFRI